MSVWDKGAGPPPALPPADPWEAEWGPGGYEKFTQHRRRARAKARARNKAEQKSQRHGPFRHMVFGVLALEGLVSILIGLSLVLYGWPPILKGKVANPIGYVGVGVCLLSVAYLAFVGLGYKLYTLLKPRR